MTNDSAISWSSSGSSIVTIETDNTTGGNVIATGVNTGTVVITASGSANGSTFTGSANGSTFTETAQLTVTDSIITDLQVTPANGTTPIGLSKQFTVMALLPDGINTWM